MVHVEFGSDFHSMGDAFRTSENCCKSASRLFLANGRQCFDYLIKTNGWKRAWFPTYFCHEIISHIHSATGIEIVYYEDSPLADEQQAINNLQFRTGDVLIRMNFFGLRTFRDNVSIPVPVIEDHSHDIIGDWASKSNADWCIASLRKLFPVATGGIIWSPKGNKIPALKLQCDLNESNAIERWSAMDKKRQYLNGITNDKQDFLYTFRQTHDLFDQLPLSTIDSRSIDELSHFDSERWFQCKKENWTRLNNALRYFQPHIKILQPEDLFKCIPFSIVMLCHNKTIRDSIRAELITESIYPAILWELPQWIGGPARLLSDTMLSLHCDGRYNENDINAFINKLKTIITKYI